MEVKFSTKNKDTVNPKWNSNIPKQNTIYIYANTTGKTIFFKGTDYIGMETRNKLIEHFNCFGQDEKLSVLQKEVTTEKDYNPFGLYPKIRIDFLSRTDFITYGEKEPLINQIKDCGNIFEYAKFFNWENNVFETLKEMEDYDEE